jgi:hypothetical protein
MLIFIFALMIFFLAEGLYESYQKEIFISQLQFKSHVKYLEDEYYVYDFEGDDVQIYNIDSELVIKVDIHSLRPVEPYETLSYYGVKTLSKIFKLE